MTTSAAQLQTSPAAPRQAPLRRLPLIVNGKPVYPGGAGSLVLRPADGAPLALRPLDTTLVDEVLGQDPMLLANVRLDDIVSFLNNVGRNWKSPEYPRRRVFIGQLVDCQGFSELQAEYEANWIAMLLCSHYRIYDIVAAELGDRHILDAWVRREEAEVRAFPLGRTLHILAGNVPLSGVASLIRALVTKNVCVVKLSSKDPVTPVALAQSFLDVDPTHPVSRAVSAVYWPGDEHGALQQRLYDGSRAICAWGGQSTIEAVTRHAPAHTEVLKFGPRRSFSVVGAGADVRATARALAHDICMYDQRACFSSQQVFVQGAIEPLRAELKVALELLTRLLPKGEHDLDEAASWSIAAREALFLGADVQTGAEQAWSIITCSPESIDAHPLGRSIFLHPIAEVREVCRYVDELTQTIGVAPWSVGLEIRDECALRGACRLVDVGLHNVFRVGGSHDAMFPLQRLVRFVSNELPRRAHVKGITVPIDQTTFLEEKKFLDYVP